MDIGKRACTVTRVGPSSPGIARVFFISFRGERIRCRKGSLLMINTPLNLAQKNIPLTKANQFKRELNPSSQLNLHTPDYGWIPFLVPPPPSPPGDRLDLPSPQVPTG